MNDIHIKWMNTYWVVQRTFQTSPLTSRKCKTFTRQPQHPPTPHPPSLTPPSCEYIYCISITTPAMHMNAFCPYFLFNLQISCTFISFPQPFGGEWGEGRAISVQQLSHRNSVRRRVTDAAVDCVSANRLLCSSHLAAVNLS